MPVAATQCQKCFTMGPASASCFENTVMPLGAVGNPYTTTIVPIEPSVPGNPFVFSIVPQGPGFGLPLGLTLDPATGIISGTPIINQIGSFIIQVDRPAPDLYTCQLVTMIQIFGIEFSSIAWSLVSSVATSAWSAFENNFNVSAVGADFPTAPGEVRILGEFNYIFDNQSSASIYLTRNSIAGTAQTLSISASIDGVALNLISDAPPPGAVLGFNTSNGHTGICPVTQAHWNPATEPTIALYFSLKHINGNPGLVHININCTGGNAGSSLDFSGQIVNN